MARLAEAGVADAVIRVEGVRTVASDVASGQGLRLVDLPQMAHIDVTEGENFGATVPDGERCDASVYFMTSGSTGIPKVVPQQHAGIIEMALGAAYVNDLGADTVSLNWMPLSHVGGILMAHIRDVVLGCEHISVETSRILADPAEWFRLVTRHRVTAVWSPNFAYRLLARVADGLQTGQGVDVSSLRFCLNGGETVAVRDCQRFEESLARFGLRGGTIAPAWGMSETGSGVLYNTTFDPFAQQTSSVSVGTPLPNVSVRIVACDDIPADEGGYLEVRGKPVLRRYAVGGPGNGWVDGWYRTGDLAAISKDGVHIIGRDDERIVANGVTWNASDLEAEVDQVAGVVVGSPAVVSYRPDPQEAEVLVAFCAAHGDPDDVARRVRDHLIDVFGLAVQRVVVVPDTAIERTSIGKIRKRSLVERFLVSRGVQSTTLALEWKAAELNSGCLNDPVPLHEAAAEPGQHLVIAGRGLDYEPLQAWSAGSLREDFEYWQAVIDTVDLTQSVVTIQVRAYEVAATKLPASHPVAAYIRAAAEGAGARSVRTVWTHPQAEPEVVARAISLQERRDRAVDHCGRIWVRDLIHVPIQATTYDGPIHFVLMGSTGRLGRELAAALQRRSHRVTLVGSEAAAPTVDRVVRCDLSNRFAYRRIIAALDAPNDGRRLHVVHLAGSPTAAANQAERRIVGPKVEGILAALSLARSTGAHMTVLSSVNAHFAGAGLAVYAGACAAAEVLARERGQGEVSVVSASAIAEARATDATTAMMARRVGFEDVGVDELASTLIAVPPRPLLLGLSVHNRFQPTEGVPQPKTTGPSSVKPAAPESSSPVTGIIMMQLQNMLPMAPITVGTNWFDLGLTSADLPGLALSLSPQLGTEITVMDLIKHPSAQALGDHLDRQRLTREHNTV